MTDFSAFIETLRNRQLFPQGASVIVTRAPGRLDVMGGIADYSGSLVLQLPIAEATFVALQPIEHPILEIVSIGREPYSIDLDSLTIPYDQARQLFKPDAPHHWT